MENYRRCDALHCKPHTLEPINESGGIYLVGLKDNRSNEPSERVVE